MNSFLLRIGCLTLFDIYQNYDIAIGFGESGIRGLDDNDGNLYAENSGSSKGGTIGGNFHNPLYEMDYSAEIDELAKNSYEQPTS